MRMPSTLHHELLDHFGRNTDRMTEHELAAEVPDPEEPGGTQDTK